MHPLKQYLVDVDERLQDFAERVGASRQTLYRIISGGQAPKPMLARRIVEATGGAITLSMLYGGGRDAAEIVGFAPRAEDAALDRDRLRLAFAVVVNHLRPDAPPPSPEMFDIAADAAASTYAALSRVTTRRGRDRLAQALRPVLEEILKETGAVPSSSALEHGADLAAQLYDHSPAASGWR
ncbi:MAG: helix-turn-helix transcriptional regulator [Parvularculaceae bacterium]